MIIRYEKPGVLIRRHARLIVKTRRSSSNPVAALLVDARLVLRVRREPIVRDGKVVVVLLEFLNNHIGFYLINESLSKSLSDFT